MFALGSVVDTFENTAPAVKVALPATAKVLSRVVAPVTSNVPGTSTLLVHSAALAPEFVCNNCLAVPSANLLTAIGPESFASLIVPSVTVVF